MAGNSDKYSGKDRRSAKDRSNAQEAKDHVLHANDGRIICLHPARMNVSPALRVTGNAECS